MREMYHGCIGVRCSYMISKQGVNWWFKRDRREECHVCGRQLMCMKGPRTVWRKFTSILAQIFAVLVLFGISKEVRGRKL